MTPQERDLILGLFQRLKPPAAGDIDPEAQAIIDQLGRQQPLALYLLAQTALVQEHALKGAQARIADLEAKATQAAAPAPRRSFLSGLLGGDQPAAAQPGWGVGPQSANRWGFPPMAAASMGGPGPWGARGGPSFLSTALSTAAGVAGGALLFQGIEGLLGGDAFASAANAAELARPTEEVTINNYGTDPQEATPVDNSDPDAADVDPDGSLVGRRPGRRSGLWG